MGNNFTTTPATSPTAGAMTVASYKNHMIHAIGGNPDTRISLLQVLNEAVRYLFDQHEWNFRARPILETTVAAVDPPTNPVTYNNYIDLPADFGEILSAHYGTRQVKFTSLEDIAHRRTNTLIPPPLAAVYVALSFPGQSDVNSLQGSPRLEIFPAPDSAATFALEYRAGAIQLVNDTDVPNIPPSFERALALLARAFICDYEEQESTNEWAEAEKELEKLKAHDGLIQSNMGPSLGGAVDERRRGRRVNFWVGTVSRS